MSHRALLATGLLMMGSWASAADFVAVRVNAPATLQHAGGTTALVPKQAIVTGDVVSAGARGKIALQLGGSGLMTLASLGDVQVFEAKAATGAQPASAKLKLLGGALRVDSRATNGKPAQDIRLNIGSLKTRLLNADAWGANTAEGDTLCLMAGAASVQTGAAADERLDVIGSCLRREPDGQLSRFAVDADPLIVSAIAATRFEGMGGVVTTLMAEAAAEEAVVTPPAPATAATPAPAGSGWTIVVLSLSKPEPVAARAQALAAQGLPATTRTATINGATMHRVAVGSFATQAEARAYAAGTLAKSGIKGWPAPL
ncbi:MAG: SPOR domain-containing protein [Stagnimonas sp.]|nr:SPOR domain-containing protein [Stagnimonas sp.]